MTALGGTNFTGCEKMHQLRHSERSEESLLNVCRRKEGFLASLGMTDHRIFPQAVQSVRFWFVFVQVKIETKCSEKPHRPTFAAAQDKKSVPPSRAARVSAQSNREDTKVSASNGTRSSMDSPVPTNRTGNPSSRVM